MKSCTKCGIEKELSEFSPDKSKKYGVTSYCHKCHNLISNKYYLNNKDKALKATRKWQDVHKKRCQENKQAWKKVNSDKVKEHYHRWWNKDIEKALALFRGYTNKRLHTVRGNLDNRFSRAIAAALNGNKKGRSWELLVGYTVESLKEHLEKNFLPGMSWENRCDWHIDHKIPKVAFNYETSDDIDFKKCWALKNLQPLWAFDNISKKDKLPKPFQPSLLISARG